MFGPIPAPAFWGKLQRDDRGVVTSWHPLIDHSIDVASVAHALLQLPTWRARLERLAGQSISDDSASHLARIAGLHDLGKVNHEFQVRRTGVRGRGHVAEGLGYARRRAVSWLGPDPGTHEALMWAICHHGGPVEPVQVDALFRASRERDPEAEIERLRHTLALAFPGGPVALPTAPGFHHAWSGLVMLADWIGSTTEGFPYSEPGEDRVPEARRRALDVIGALNLDPAAGGWRELADPLAGLVPRPAQQVVADWPVDAEGSLLLLEAETGSGKTEAAMLRFRRLLAAGLVDGMYFALPTRAAALQLHTRISRWMAASGGPPPILAVPGYLRVGELEGATLAPFHTLWPDHDARRWEVWAAENTKRYCAGAIVVGTIDQALLSTLQVRHAAMRSTALLRQLLVVDEVHASDTYMASVLRSLLEFHRAAGGHALLMSATLGAKAAAELLRPRSRGRVRTNPVIGFDEAVAVPYPRVLDATGREGVAGLASAQKRVELRCVDLIDDTEALADLALRLMDERGKVLCIRNTVDACVALHTAIARRTPDVLFTVNGLPVPHHGRYAPADRKLLDAAVEDTFRSRGRFIVVATQTIEQSLDLDADVLITDLCPADVLLQRIGRLHRHRIDATAIRPAPCFVLVPDGEGNRGGHGLGTVYQDVRALTATWRLAETGEWRLPADNRRLVEGALHPDSPFLPRDDVSVARAARLQGKRAGERGLAQDAVIDRTQSFAGMRAVGPDVHVSTRLDEEGEPRRVPLSPPWRSPLGASVDELRIPARWLGEDREADAVVVVHDVAVDVTIGVRRFRYGSNGLERVVAIG